MVAREGWKAELANLNIQMMRISPGQRFDWRRFSSAPRSDRVLVAASSSEWRCPGTHSTWRTSAERNATPEAAQIGRGTSPPSTRTRMTNSWPRVLNYFRSPPRTAIASPPTPPAYYNSNNNNNNNNNNNRLLGSCSRKPVAPERIWKWEAPVRSENGRWVVPLHFLALKTQLVVLVSVFVMVSFLFAVLLLTVSSSVPSHL